jgi:signal transduction histidine kinase
VGLDYVPTGAVISIEIINPDPGITDEQRLKIFDPTEVALKMARITIRRHGGRIEEVGGAGENAAFRITVPTKRGGERQ